MNGDALTALGTETQPNPGPHQMPYWPTGTVYGTLLNFQGERELFAPQMTQPPYKAPPKAPVLFVKTANTWSTSGAAVPVPSRVPQVEVGAAIANDWYFSCFGNFLAYSPRQTYFSSY